MKHPLSVDLSLDHENGEMYGSPIPDEKKMASETIMPYLQRYFMCRLEAIAYFKPEPEKLKTDLEALARFVRFSCGIHASIAFSNEVDRLCQLSDEDLIEITNKIFRS